MATKIRVLSIEDAVKAITKDIVNHYTATMEGRGKEKPLTLSIANRFKNVSHYDDKTNSHKYYFVYQKHTTSQDPSERYIYIAIGYSDYLSQAALSSRVYNAVFAKIKTKLGKTARIIINRAERYVGQSVWSRDKVVLYMSFTILWPCKEFLELEKKMQKLCNATIQVSEWSYQTTFGKRSDWEVDKTYYYATIPKACTQVLDFLKGKKKVTYTGIKFYKNFEDQAYGEEYETEWSGSIVNYASFKDSNDKVHNFGIVRW